MKLLPNAGARTGVILPVCTAVLLCAAGCTRKSELPLPPGAYLPDGYVPEYAEPIKPPVPPEAVQTPEIPGLSSANDSIPYGNEDLPVLQPTEMTDNEGNPETLPPPPAKSETQKLAPLPEKPFSKPNPNDKIYIVKKGDTLNGIAYRNKVNSLALAEYNGISKNGIIHVGDKIRIPADAPATAVSNAVPAAIATSANLTASDIVYTVKANDTLSEIAERHNVRTADIVTLNKLDSKKPIFPGQKLKIPANQGTTNARAKKPVSSSAKKPADTKAETPVKPADTKAETPAKPADTKEETPAKPAEKTNAPDEVNETPSAAPDKVAAPTPAPESEIDESAVITLNVDREMTLEEAAKAFDRPYAIVKKLNPTISEDTRLKAGASIRIPIF